LFASGAPFRIKLRTRILLKSLYDFLGFTTSGHAAGPLVALDGARPSPFADLPITVGCLRLAMFTALASLPTNRTLRKDASMTGEISLRCLVPLVGGIKEKVVAAA
jgi:hypothetical protein